MFVGNNNHSTVRSLVLSSSDISIPHFTTEKKRKMTRRVAVGIDIGSESTKVTLGPSLSCEIVRTASGGHTTPTAVSFAGGERHMGETASRKGKNAVLHLNRLLMGGLLKSSGNDEEDPFEPF